MEDAAERPVQRVLEIYPRHFSGFASGGSSHQYLLIGETYGLCHALLSCADVGVFLRPYHSVVRVYDIRHQGWKFVDVLFFAVGIALGVVICTLSPTTTPDDLWFIFICGAIAVCTMILPGISGSFILVILGKYDYIMQSVNQLNLPVLLVFGLGCVIGILGFSKFLHWLLKRYERATMLTLVGFVIGALVKVWPWNDMTAVAEGQLLRSGMTAEAAQAGAQTLLSAGNTAQGIDLQIPGAIIWAIAGLALVAVLEYLSSLQKLMAEKKN